MIRLNDLVKLEAIRTILTVSGILAVFFAGFLLRMLYAFSVVLFIAGTIVLCIQVEIEEGQTSETKEREQYHFF